MEVESELELASFDWNINYLWLPASPKIDWNILNLVGVLSQA